MDFWKTLLVLLKRWYVALPVFAVAIGGAGAVYAVMPMHYESTGVIVLTAPPSGPTTTVTGQSGQTNPLLAFESSLAISASIVIQSINTPEVVKEMGADKPDHTFVLTGGAEGGPFISVKTESKSEQGARDLVVQVLDRVKGELQKRQELLKAPTSTFIGVDDVVPPTKPEPLRGGKLRAAGVALVLGLVASLAAVFGFESFQSRKRRAEEAELDEDFDEEPEDEPVAPVKKAAVKQAVVEDEPVEVAPRAVPAPADHTQRVAPVRAKQNGHPAKQAAHPKPATPHGKPAPQHGPKQPAAANAGQAGGPAPANGSVPAGGPAPAGGQAPANGPTPANGPAPANGQAPGKQAPANGHPQQAPANGQAKPSRVNGQPVGTGPNPSNWPADEWREPPTLRMKPAQAPPDQRS
ncbi:hypothetical protein [Actinokineospora sp. HUAS TT18]|uniref:hypothetical protein n=1 Tax=Actinokineospora sp. HUAS TT18 TaxID=3447451 RepID=UPI003F5278D2